MPNRLLPIVVLSAAAAAAFAAEPVPPVIKVKEKFGFLRGNTHVHTDRSGDCDTPVPDVVKWYEERGYDFIVLTDHNHVTAHDHKGRIKVFAGVEMTFNVAVSDGLDDFGGACVHMNGLFADPTKKGFVRDGEPADRTRLAHYEAELKSVAALGGLACVNHPNYTFAADAATLLRLTGKGLRFFEVYNSADKSLNDGAAGRPSTEKIWDAVLTGGGVLYGLVSDDTHNYYDAAELLKAGFKPRIGDLAWIMVRAKTPDEAELRKALLAGDFYGSTGVTLRKLDVSVAAMEIEVAPEPGRTYVIRFVGRGGKVLAEKEGTAARYPIAGDEGYVRAMVIDSAGRKAWIQPTFVRRK